MLSLNCVCFTFIESVSLQGPASQIHPSTGTFIFNMNTFNTLVKQISYSICVLYVERRVKKEKPPYTL